MTVDIEFEVGQKVWACLYKSKEKSCGFCGGDGETIGFDKSVFPCPACEGSGRDAGKMRYQPKELTVGSINISIGSKVQTWYLLVDQYQYNQGRSLAKDTFATEAEVKRDATHLMEVCQHD